MGEYYAAARLDYLVRKEEIIGIKAIETYSDRPDCLVYRSATYGPMPPGHEGVRSALCMISPPPRPPVICQQA